MGAVVMPEQTEAFARLAARASDSIDRRALLSALAKLQARWVNQLGGRGTKTVRLTPAQEEAYLVQVRQLFDQLRHDRPSLAAVTDAQVEAFARAGLVMAFNRHQRRGPDGKWIKMGGPGSASTPDLPTPRSGAPSGLRRGSGVNQTEMAFPYQIPDLLAEVGDGKDERSEYIRRAINTRIEMGDESALVVARDAQTNELTGAAAFTFRDDAGHDSVLIEYMGATEGSNAGTDLVREVMRTAQYSDAIYAEPTASSRGFWERMGFEHDPLEVGTDFVGLDKAGMGRWLNEHPPPGLVAAAGQARATDLQRFRFVFGLNPHQRRGPDGRWIRMPTSELKRPRRSGKGRARTRHVEFEHRDGKPVYKVGGRERNWTPAEARAVADALDATADGQSVDAPVRGRVVTDGVQRRTIEQVQPFRNNKGGVTLDVGRDRGKDGSGEVELTDAQARALAKDLREAADRQEGHDRAAAVPASLDPPEYATQTPPVNLPDPAAAYQEALEEYNLSNYNVAWTVRQRNRDARRPDAYLDLLMDEYDAAQGTGAKADVADRISGHLDIYYPEDALALDPKPDRTTYLTVPALPPGPRTTGGARPPVGAPIADRQTALDRSIRSGLNSQETLSGGAIGDTRRVRLGDGTEAIYKRAKKVANGRTPEEQTDAEELASAVAEAIGVRAPATVRASPTEIYMEVMPGKSAMASGMQYADRNVIDSPEGKKLGLLDVLLNNSDRHTGNWMRGDNGEIAAIDHGFAFDKGEEWSHSAFTPSFRGGSNPLTPSDISHVARQLDQIKPQFEAMGRGDWYRKMRLRLNQLDREARGTTSLYPTAVTAAQRLAFASRGTLTYGGMA